MRGPWRIVFDDPAPEICEGPGSDLWPNRGRTARWWRLHLVCGHTAERPVKYKQVDGPGRGKVRTRPAPEAVPAPGKVRCEPCLTSAKPA